MVNWKILDLKSQISDNLVVEVSYECRVTIDKFMDRKIGRVTLTGDTTDVGFIPFNDLTEEITLNWVFDSLGDEKEEIESILTSNIDDNIAKRTARTHKNGTPWGKRGKPE
jgi:hypothetical protein